MQQHRHTGLITYLDHAMSLDMGDAVVVDFVFELFNILGYVCRQRVAHTRVDLWLLICGEYRHAQTDVCIINSPQNEILLLVQEDKRLGCRNPSKAQARLVAEAVAAFDENNLHRDAIRLPRMTEKVSHFVSLLTLF